MNRRKCGRPPKFVIAFCIIAAVFLFSAIVMLLWNATLPDVMPVGKLSYWQAMGILILSKILFSGLGGPKGRGRFRSAQDLRDKFRSMSDEERARLKQEWKERCRARF
ncbi:hypothetical protein [Niabella ginsengisoli]|uniref:DUF1682 domain-containing protein n=1 Tax=Niabella ginsengisoli TaxID=522298 RepID=A0ABS9SQ95_9BACT|nr:hypothetical protein [Niabella ginsengisoli]MCH5600537.1 hypothetical protein [Niabella ginsengisoli]